jgi:SWIM zinc finger
MNWLKNKRKISRHDLIDMLKRIDRAYGILELNEREPVILEMNKKELLFKVRSSNNKGKFYKVDADIKICTCPDFSFRLLKCKHIIAAEFASGITS